MLPLTFKPSSLPPPSSLPSPRPLVPRRRRSNHLRTKLLQPPFLHTPKPPPPLDTTTPLQDLDEEAPSLPSETLLLLEEEGGGGGGGGGEKVAEEPEEVSRLVSHIGDPLPHAAASVDKPGTLLGLPPFLGSLLVSAYVLLLFDGEEWSDREEVVEGERKGSEEVGEFSLRKKEWGELEGKAREIRAMAREAREIERRGKDSGREEEEERGSSYTEIRMGVRDEVEWRARRVAEGRMHSLSVKNGYTKSGKDVKESGRDGETTSIRKKLEFGRMRAAAAAVEARSPPKGFGGAKSKAAAGKRRDDDGAIQQITKGVVLEHRTSQSVDHGSNETRVSTSSVDSTISTPKASFGGLDPQARSEDGGLKSSSGASGSGVNDIDLNIVRDAPSNGSFSKNNAKMDDVIMHGGGAIDVAVKEEWVGSGVPDSQSSSKKKLQNKAASTNGFTNNKSTKKHRTKHKSDPRSGKNQKAGSEYWWLKLPYVLVICLHRGSNGSSQRGFYKLKMDPLSNSTLSYTVAFEDRGDAKNFCYLLESFFEDLGDVSADILPVTTQEVEKVVKTKKLNMIVVRTGQLQLYAGKPLEEVETTLRSILQQSAPT